MPKVTVLMPVYNAERWVARAAASILRQTHGDLTLLCLDDGSTDDSVAALERVRATDDRVEIVRGEHAGIAATLNRGLELATTDLVARMDADDTCDPSRLARQVAHFDAWPDALAVGTAAAVVDGEGRTLYVNHVPTSPELIVERLQEKPALVHGTAMMRRDAVLAVGGYRTDAVPVEDHDLWLRLSERGPLYNLPEPLYAYHLADGSITARAARTLWIRRQWVVACAAARRRGDAEPERDAWEARARLAGANRRAKAYALRSHAARHWGRGDATRAAAAFCGALLLEPRAATRGLIGALRRRST